MQIEDGFHLIDGSHNYDGFHKLNGSQIADGFHFRFGSQIADGFHFKSGSQIFYGFHFANGLCNKPVGSIFIVACNLIMGFMFCLAYADEYWVSRVCWLMQNSFGFHLHTGLCSCTLEFT